MWLASTIDQRTDDDLLTWKAEEKLFDEDQSGTSDESLRKRKCRCWKKAILQKGRDSKGRDGEQRRFDGANGCKMYSRELVKRKLSFKMQICWKESFLKINKIEIYF